MKKLSALILALSASGCATPGDVEKVAAGVDNVAERQVASDKTVREMIAHVAELKREIDSLDHLMTSMRKRIDALSPPSRPLSGEDLERLLAGAPMDPVVRANLDAYLKVLHEVKPEKAIEDALTIPADKLLPYLVLIVRKLQSPARPNAILVLSKAKPADAAPILEPYLSDGSVRGELLNIMAEWEAHDATRQALLKHANEGTESWRVMLADALTKARSREGVKTLIDFLYSEEPTIRSIAIEGLKWGTGFDMGYKMYAGKEDRWAVADKWKAWWKENEAKFEFPKH
ncbi:MAG: hypothetical protein FD180_3111 [Planctomycetota bacterium]|nr:MAG: hypothetical protein FD180_3111 [Planctomycetota bacterium]